MYKYLNIIFFISLTTFFTNKAYSTNWDVCSNCSEIALKAVSSAYAVNNEERLVNILDLENETLQSFLVLKIREREGEFFINRIIVTSVEETVGDLNIAAKAFELVSEGSGLTASGLGLVYQNAGQLTNSTNAANVANAIEAHLATNFLANENTQSASELAAMSAAARSTVFAISFSDSSVATFNLSSIDTILDEDGDVVEFTFSLSLKELRDGQGNVIPMSESGFPGLITTGTPGDRAAWDSAVASNSVTITWGDGTATRSWMMSCTTVAGKIICTAVPISEE